MAQLDSDVIIIGAGPGGTSASYFLSQAGIRVLLLDKSEFPRDKTCGDGIPPRGLQILNDMNILDTIESFGWRLETIKITSPSGSAVNVPIPEMPHGLSHALIAPRFKLDNALLENAIHAGAIFLSGVHVSHVSHSEDGVYVRCEQGKEVKTFSAKMAILATGTSTKVLINSRILKTTPQPIVAARAYFENLSNLDNKFHFLFGGVTLPGYGWVFPLSPTSANIGTGFIVNQRTKAISASPRNAFDTFINSPALKGITQGARQIGELRSYPLRIDFATAPTYGERVLLVGEAAGLVNPLTGDGIDYALESGRIAAEHITAMIRENDFSADKHVAYDKRLRAKYQSLFVYCERIQRAALNAHMLNLLVPMANRLPKLAELLTITVLGGKEVPENMSIFRVVKELITHI